MLNVDKQSPEFFIEPKRFRPILKRTVIDAREIQTVAELVLRYGLVLVVAWIGGMKFTTLEAAGIQPLVGSSPFLSWMYRLLSAQTVSNLFGVVEISIATMIAVRPWAPKVSALGSGLASLMFLTTLSFLSLAISAGGLHAQQDLLHIARVVRLDPRFDKLVPSNVKIEKIAGLHKWVEGPVWNRKDGYLLFSDIPNNSIYKWQEGKGESLFLKPSGYSGRTPFEGAEPGSNGLTYDPAGRLVLAEHGDRCIARLEKNGRKTTLVDRYEGKRINSPNDLVFKSNGDLYFTDPPFGLPKSFDDPQKELPFQGVYRFSKDGKLALITKDIKAPNGIAFSPDERKLYISNAETSNAVWMVYDVTPDGNTRNGKILFNATVQAQTKKGAPDGMKTDREGNIFGAGPGGVYVIAPDGTQLGSIDLGGPTGNVAWGEDGTALFITSNTTVYRLKLTTKGAGF